MSTNTQRFTTSFGVVIAAGVGLAMWGVMIAAMMWAVSL